MADGIDAAMDAVELTAINAVSDRSRSQPSRFELSPRNHAMLPRREFRHLGILSVAFLTHVGT
ncbi:MAG: hypothetical protein M3335_05125 [Actinomycetota bacterium]|nr:hypothetical protein [Actinomycetota bacterium]